jgi:hypothetical protein
MFQPTFDTTTEDHLGWDEFGYGDILTTMDVAPRQAEEVSASQLTEPLPVWTQPSQLTPAAGGATTASGATPAVGGATLAGGATPAGGGATPDAAGSSQAAMATPSPDQLGPRVVRAPDPGRMTGTRPGMALELLGGRGTGAFRCSTTFTMILYKLFPSTR